ncbi:DUF4192 domain-containing protein [Allonocardiopsis opalescens]|uniref:Uncharacterized protein DUF4192 n=1 Tax=Allonocardiopsis opalescens TaxID=1144618 RepID=A0A2T0PXH7_9ACTN|nr:DUF4192 domain-containing protein [Allonocardiopsis opalescens]PRX96243.1 uncharacterized protein DUF4192 [Allonocardiopsis opalescens]
MSTSPAAERAATLLHLSKPTDVLAAVPYVLGFRPEHSVVVLGLAGARSRSRFAGRADLPAPDDALGRYELAERFVAPFRVDGCDQAVVVGYGPAERADPAVRLVNQTLTLEGVRLREALRVENGRYWSYVCEVR